MSEDPSVGWRRDLHVSTVDDSPATEAVGQVRVPGLTILAHPDPGRIGEVACLSELPAGRAVELSRLVPLFASPDGKAPDGAAIRRPLADAHLSRSPSWLRPGVSPGSVEVEEGGQPVDAGVGLPATFSSGELGQGRVLLLGERVALLLHRVDPTPSRGDDLGLVGASPAVATLRDAIRRLARSEVPVLLRGETGTGKELVAAALHRLSARRDRPFVCVDMAALPPSLAASELFGAAKGAFTGADRQRSGHFQRADGGTLFLDEIGDAPQEVQASILRALETGEVARVGGGAPRRVDVRVIAATDADLEARVRDGSFRAPLLHRLEGAALRLPPLRARRCDVARLLVHFLYQELAKCDGGHRLSAVGKDARAWLPAPLVAELVRKPWPGNVRQLRNVARQIVLHFHDRPYVAPDSETLAAWGSHSAGESWGSAGGNGAGRRSGSAASEPPSIGRLRQPSQLSEAEVAAALESHRWRIQPAARALGISRTSLYALIDEMPGLRRASQIPRSELVETLRATDGDLEEMVSRLKISRHGLQQRLRELDLP